MADLFQVFLGLECLCYWTYCSVLKGFSRRPIYELEDEEPLAPLHAEPEKVHQILVAHFAERVCMVG
jgi:hypothetical protein